MRLCKLECNDVLPYMFLNNCHYLKLLYHTYTIFRYTNIDTHLIFFHLLLIFIDYWFLNLNLFGYNIENII